MRIIDLKDITKGQDVPKIAYRPIKALEDRIYFEKVQGTLEEEWTEGIYRFDLEDKALTRIDTGRHEQDPSLYDIDVPGSYEDVLVMKSMDYIYYCVATELMREMLLEFFIIDTRDDSQSEILSFTFPKQEFIYRGMEILTSGYFLFTLADSENPFESTIKDKVYFVDIEAKSLYEIHDNLFKMTSGKRVVAGEEQKHILIEETYLSEEEELELLVSSDVELDMEIPEDLTEDFVFHNSIKYLPFENFLRLVKIGSKSMQFRTLDSIYKEGVLRVIGESEAKLYYKKNKHEFLLQESKELKDRLMIGKEEIFSLNKNTLEIEKIADLGAGTMVAFENDKVYEVYEDEKKIDIKDVDTEDFLCKYEKVEAEREHFYDIFADRYLVIGVFGTKDKPKESYLKIVDTKGEEKDRKCEDLFIIGDTAFIG